MNYTKPCELFTGGHIGGGLLRWVGNILYEHVLSKVLISSWTKVKDKFPILQIVGIGVVSAECWRSVEPVHMSISKTDDSNPHVLLMPLHDLVLDLLLTV